jgi:hypothetical protein
MMYKTEKYYCNNIHVGWLIKWGEKCWGYSDEQGEYEPNSYYGSIRTRAKAIEALIKRCKDTMKIYMEAFK